MTFDVQADRLWGCLDDGVDVRCYKIVQDACNMGVLTKLKEKAYVLDTRYEAVFASDVSERAKTAFAEAGVYARLAPTVLKSQQE